MGKIKKILIHTIVFSPDSVSTAYLYNDIALGFRDHGYDVVVLTTTPHYNRIDSELSRQPLSRKWMGLYYESYYKGIKVLHIPQKKFQNAMARALGMLYWHILSIVLGLLQRKVDIILSASPPLSIGLVSAIIGKIKGAKTIYNIQEIYPDLFINHKGIKNQLIIKSLGFLEQLVYSWSNALVTIDDVFYNTIKDRVDPISKLQIIPNFVDTEIFSPIPKGGMRIDRKLFPDNDSLKVMYAGNIGYAQDWETLLNLATEIKDCPVEFWIVGDGVQKERLERYIKESRLTKIHLVPYQHREVMPYLISYADIHFILMNQKVENHGFPSKIYTIMACGKPLIISSGENTPLYSFFKNLDCAFLLSAENIEKRVAELKQLIINILKNPDVVRTKGLSAAMLVRNQYSNKVIVPKYVDLADKLIEKVCE